MRVSLNPTSYTSGGGLIDDVDVRITEAKWLNWDYNGGGPKGPALALALQVIADDTTHEQFFSAGKLDFFAPSKDGETPASDEEGDFLCAVGDKTALNNNTNAAKFLISLVNAGFPADKLDGPVSALAGTEFHLRREAVKRTGLVRTGKNADREQTVVTCSKILKLPWDSAAGKPATAASGAPKNTTAGQSVAKPNGKAGPAVSADLEGKATEHLMGVLFEAGGKLPKAQVATKVFNALKGDPDQKAISSLVFNDEFLKRADGIKYDGAVVTLAE